MLQETLAIPRFAIVYFKCTPRGIPGYFSLGDHGLLSGILRFWSYVQELNSYE